MRAPSKATQKICTFFRKKRPCYCTVGEKKDIFCFTLYASFMGKKFKCHRIPICNHVQLGRSCYFFGRFSPTVQLLFSSSTSKQNYCSYYHISFFLFSGPNRCWFLCAILWYMRNNTSKKKPISNFFEKLIRCPKLSAFFFKKKQQNPHYVYLILIFKSALFCKLKKRITLTFRPTLPTPTYYTDQNLIEQLKVKTKQTHFFEILRAHFHN
jgi:hypothetical protein